MNCIWAIGETVMDILFKNRQPIASVPGGSCYNSIISVGRSGVPCHFIGYTGGDIVGTQIRDFLCENGVNADYFRTRSNERSCISLAYLDDNGDADYVFYKEPPRSTPEEADSTIPFTSGDILLYGSYYAICPGTRQQVLSVLKQAASQNVTVYYDINYRRSHKEELESLLPCIQHNMQHSDIVRGSADDFDIMFETRDGQAIYDRYISPFCKVFIYTSGNGSIIVFSPAGKFEFAVPQIPAQKIVSTVGAGDNFNAGLMCALYQNNVTGNDLATLGREEWETLVNNGIKYAAAVCQSSNNYIPQGFIKTK